MCGVRTDGVVRRELVIMTGREGQVTGRVGKDKERDKRTDSTNPI